MSDPKRRRPRLLTPDTAAPDPKDVLPLARKLVGLAQEQQRALELGAQEQFEWIALRRDEATERLSRLLAAEVEIPPEDAEVLKQLHDELLVADGRMEEQLRTQMARAQTKQRSFGKARKALGAYLASSSRRPGLVDERH